MSELALKLIAENKKTRAPFLDLGNCGLTGIPEELGELIWLEELSFAENRLKFDAKEWSRQKTKNTGSLNNISSLNSSVSISANVKSHPFSKLTNLKKLWLNGEYSKKFDFHDLTPLSSLTGLQMLDISGTQVNELSPLTGLTSLRTLEFWLTKVRDLNPLTSLTDLVQLNVGGTQVNDLSPLTGLTNLNRLYAWQTNVSDLNPLTGLTNLQQLTVGGTQVNDLSPLTGLTNLQRLNVSYTRVKDLSPILTLIENGIEVKWSADAGDSGINVVDCPLTVDVKVVVA